MNPTTIYEQTQQTVRQLASGDITQHKAIMRCLKMLSSILRPVAVTFHLKDGAIAPHRAHDSDAAWDLYYTGSKMTIYPGESALVDTGVSVALPEGTEAQVRSRSGLALKEGLHVLNAPGTIDSGYRESIGVIIHNASNEKRSICPGDRVAQLSIRQLPEVVFNRVDDNQWARIPGTDRGTNGFGSTGK